MIPPVLAPAPGASRATDAATGKVLRRLFLTLFLRGRGARGLKKDAAPKSVGRKLGTVLVIYALFGCYSLFFVTQPVFALSVYLHGLSFVFLGMFVASSAGEILFNREEADILLHRPIAPRALLWAKISVLVQVSLWLAGALNLAGLFVGAFGPHGNYLYPFVHAVSTAMEALFCTGSVVLAYQLCLRWFGRDRLDGLMTTAQILVSVGAMLAGQILPRTMMRMGGSIHFGSGTWWMALVPPAWFAGIDDALAGTGEQGAWILASIGTLATVAVLGLAFGKLAGDYERGLQRLGQTAETKPRGGRRRWMDAIVSAPPLRWWLRDPVTRASFLLVAAYLARDRDAKLRVYPGIAPMMLMPVIFLFQGSVQGGAAGGIGNLFGLAFAGSYLGMIPLIGLGLVGYSQQWQAADIFRAAPMAGPAPMIHGARRAVLLFLTAPMVVAFGLVGWLAHHDVAVMTMMLPGLVALPVYSLVPGLQGNAVPFSQPGDEAKAAGRGWKMLAAMFVSFAIAGLAIWSHSAGWFWWMLLGEAIVAAIAYLVMLAAINRSRWESLE